MRLLTFFAVAIVAPIVGLAAPASQPAACAARGDNLCSQYKSPPKLCTPDPTVTVEETAKRAYQFYKAFVVDGDARLMFSLIDNSYIVRLCPIALLLFLCFLMLFILATSSGICEWSTGYLVAVLQRKAGW